MKRIAILEYSFMFDPDETWGKGSEFEINLASFFKSEGYDAQVVTTTGNSSRRVLYISKPVLGNPPPIVNKPMTFKKPTGVK